jgi:hypothetical protein
MGFELVRIACLDLSAELFVHQTLDVVISHGRVIDPERQSLIWMPFRIGGILGSSLEKSLQSSLSHCVAKPRSTQRVSW